jgi:hypothetical protein
MTQWRGRMARSGTGSWWRERTVASWARWSAPRQRVCAEAYTQWWHGHAASRAAVQMGRWCGEWRGTVTGSRAGWASGYANGELGC